MKCKFCGKEISDYKGALTKHQNYCINNPNRIIYNGHAISEETKKQVYLTVEKFDIPVYKVTRAK